MFYLFFESRTNKKDPVVIWLTGGPGCSSELAVFYENGPYTIANNLSLVWNEYGWDKVYRTLSISFFLVMVGDDCLLLLLPLLKDLIQLCSFSLKELIATAIDQNILYICQL